MMEAWKPIGRPSRRWRTTSSRATRRSARRTCSTGTRRAMNHRHSATETACEATVARAAPPTPSPAPRTSATTRAMLRPQQTARNTRGVRESPMARTIAARKLKNIVVTAPAKLTVAKVRAWGTSSGGVWSRVSAGPVARRATAVRTTLAAAVRTAPVATERRTAAASPAPNACAVGIAKPDVMPHAKPSSRNSRLPVEPTAARASTPSVRPTMNASVTWYSCWTTLPTSSGTAKTRMTRQGRPVVRTLAMTRVLPGRGGAGGRRWPSGRAPRSIITIRSAVTCRVLRGNRRVWCRLRHLAASARRSTARLLPRA